MFVVQVMVQVKAESVEAFKSASVANATASLTEPGVARFDVIQEIAAPTRFVLVEVYRTEADAGRHKDTAHYKKWRDTVAPMMAQPRSAIKYRNIFPDEPGWEMAG